MTTDDKEIVTAMRAALAERLGQGRYDFWFGAGTQIQWDGRTLTIGVPNHFVLDWIRTSFRTDIENTCVEVIGRSVPVKFQVDSAAVNPVGDGAADAKPNPPATGDGASQPPNGHSQSFSTRRSFASLASFVTGPGNHLAFVSAEMVARSPGQVTPLLIHGPTSVGKTHLLEGIWTAAKKACRGMTVLYVSAEQFTSQFVEALRGSGLPNFRQKYRSAGLLIVDDLQFLGGKRATQTEMVHTIDALSQAGRQIVFAADRPPNALTQLSAELITRLTGGMVCRIDPPDYATRLGIVGQFAARLKLDVPLDVQRFIAARLTGHARELSGAMFRLRATSQALGEPIRQTLAEEALGEMIHYHSRVVRLGDIQNAVCQVFGLSPDSLQADGKSKRLSHPRMLAMWLARKHTRAALSEIGQFFGRRSHSTVVSAQKRVDQWMAQGESLHLAEKTWEIEEAIRQVERELLAG